MASPPTSPVAAAGLLGGFAVARYSGRRELGGLVLAACGGWSGREWARRGGPRLAIPLGLTYATAFGASHPLAKRLGAWPSVLAVTAVAAGAAAAFGDRS